MNGSDWRRDVDQVPITLPPASTERAWTRADIDSGSPPTKRWLSERSKAIAYVTCVAAIALAGAAIVHGEPSPGAGPSPIAAPPVTMAALPAPAAAMATVVLEPVTIVDQWSTTEPTAINRARPPPSPTVTTTASRQVRSPATRSGSNAVTQAPKDLEARRNPSNSQ